MQKKAKIEELRAGCGYCTGVTSPYIVGSPKAIADPDNPGDCEDIPGNPDAPNQGEQFEPRER